jgi:hypothetical protein
MLPAERSMQQSVHSSFMSSLSPFYCSLMAWGEVWGFRCHQELWHALAAAERQYYLHRNGTYKAEEGRPDQEPRKQLL